MSSLKWIAQRQIGETPRLADQVRNLLLEGVTSGLLRPGDRINEAELARRLGISRNPIREAISGLAQKGFLVAVPRRGHFMRSFSRQDLDDIFSFRICVETFALRQAMARSGAGAAEGLRSIFERMVMAAERMDLGDLQEADVEFHRSICELSGNSQTVRAHEGIETELRMVIAFVDLDHETPMQSALVHLPIVDAIATGSAEKAVAEMEIHIRQTWNNVIEIYEAGMGKPLPV